MDIGVSQDNQQTGVLLHTLFSRHPTAKETVSPKERENKIVYLPPPPDTLIQPIIVSLALLHRHECFFMPGCHILYLSSKIDNNQPSLQIPDALRRDVWPQNPGQ